jgi:hypothetical protein
MSWLKTGCMVLNKTTFEAALLSPLTLLVKNYSQELVVVLAFLPELLCLQQLHRALLEHAANHHSVKGPGLAAPRHCNN